MASILALAALSPAGAQDRPMLVEYLPMAAQSSDDIPGTDSHALDQILGDPGVLALRIGHAAPKSVIQARALSIELPGSGETLTFDDLVVEALDSGHALYSGDHQSTTTTTLVVMGKDVAGTIHHDGAIYAVQPLGNGLTAVYHYDATYLRKPPEIQPDFVIPDREPEEAGLPHEHAPPAAQDSRSRIDVLVVYPSSVRRGAGNVDVLIAQLVLRTNQAYRNSGITTRLRVVHSYETSYEPLAGSNFDDKETDLRRLQRRDDGHLDEVFAKRDQFGADVVILLFRHEVDYNCGGGTAYILHHGPGDSEWAFGVSGTGSAAAIGCDASTFAHEIGHIQGARHNPEEYDNPRSNTYVHGHGLCNTAKKWRTVMSYNTGDRCEPRIQHFSSPVVLYQGTATGDPQLRNVARLINETAVHVANFRQAKTSQGGSYSLPLVTPASNIERVGFVRIINHSARAGEVSITAIDDSGRRFGPVSLSLEAQAAVQFRSRDLENGNTSRGLSGGVGDGTGNWRLEMTTTLEIEPLAYIRTSDGFVTNMHEVAAETQEGSNRYQVPFFNPGKNENQVSSLRLINPGDAGASIAITGVDDDGRAPSGVVQLTLGAGMARMLSARELEDGSSEITGRLGAGTGKWRLSVSADRPIRVMSLLELPTGHLTNLSRGWEGVSVETPPPPPTDQPDLVVQSPSVSDSSPNVGQSFTLTATVRNQGTARSATTTLRYFRSSDATITTGDTQVGTDSVSGLSAAGTSTQSVSLTAPSSAGTYYYGACVDTVSGEADTENNCSSAVRVTVTGPGSGNYVGAIAAGWRGQYCSDGFGWGYALNFPDRESAISTAESECRSLGLHDCSWIAWFSRCGALAYGQSTSGCWLFGDYGDTRAAAEQNALSRCLEEDYFIRLNCRIPVATDGTKASYCNSGAGASGADTAHPHEAQSAGSITDSPSGASNSEARPEPKPSRRRSDGG